MEKELRVLETFSGIGAPRKALMRGGYNFKIVDSIEIDPKPIKSYNAIYGEDIKPQDISKWFKTKEELGEIDLLWNSSPCQDFSSAGKNAGGEKDSGTRSSLVYEVLRIAKEFMPKYIIWENVKGLTFKKHKPVLDDYIARLNDMGYTSTWQILNSKDYGIPQNRARVFVVSIRNDLDTNFIFPKKQELKLRLKDILEENVDDSYYLSDEKIQKIAHWKSFQKPFEKVQGKESVVPTLTARGGCEEHSGMITYSDKLENTTNLQNQILKKQLCNYLIQNDLVKENDVIRHSYSKSRMENWDKRNISANNYSPTLDTRCDCFGVCIKNNTKKGYLEAHPGDGVYTNTSTKRGTVQKESIATLTTFQDKGVVMSDLRIRKLTPKECWRLMGFEDSDYEKASQVTSKAQLYKQAGNSIVVNVIEAIFDNLLKDYQ